MADDWDSKSDAEKIETLKKALELVSQELDGLGSVVQGHMHGPDGSVVLRWASGRGSVGDE